MPVSPRTWDVLVNDFAHAAEWLQRVAWSPSTPREVVERWQGIVFTAEQPIALADFRAVDRFDNSAAPGKVRCPTLVLGGADDLMTPPAAARALADVIPGAELRILPHAGHQAMLEQPTAFHAELDRFLVSIP
jgi:pimeloyl-ACP methyl ester carboxylesterase